MNNLQVPSKFKHTTRLGNWSEEWELEQIRKKEYLRMKANKTLPSFKQEENLLKAYQPASLSLSKDGLLRFGDHIMLFNGKTQGFLATDTFQGISKTEENYYASTVHGLHACSRSVFIIERHNSKDSFEDDVVHYGQQFKLRVNPLLVGKDKFLYLHSQPQNDRKFSQKTRMQEVVWALKDTYNLYNLVWSFENPDFNQRLQTQGEPVKVTDNVLIKHLFTNRWLASDIVQFDTFFGKEFQVMVHNYMLNSKAQCLKNQSEGKTTADFAQKGQKIQNLWVIVNARDKSQNFDETVIKKPQTLPNLMQKIRFMLSQRGIYGLRFLSKIYQNMDLDKCGGLDYQDFMWGMKASKIYLDNQQFSIITSNFGPQKINYRKFIHEIRGSLSETRQKIIRKAFQTIARRCGGESKITVEEIGKIFDAKKHPEVLKGQRQQKKAFSQFVVNWNHVQPDYTVSWEQFLDYFWDVSATIPRDDHFQFLMISVWHP